MYEFKVFRFFVVEEKVINNYDIFFAAFVELDTEGSTFLPFVLSIDEYKLVSGNFVTQNSNSRKIVTGTKFSLTNIKAFSSIFEYCVMSIVLFTNILQSFELVTRYLVFVTSQT